MTMIRVIADGDDAWVDLKGWVESGDPRLIMAMGSTTRWQLSYLEAGMESGSASIGLRLDLPDGRVVLAETSWGALQMAFAALKGRSER